MEAMDGFQGQVTAGDGSDKQGKMGAGYNNLRRKNSLADKAISDPKVGKEWCQRMNRAVFTWRKPCREAGKVTYQDRHSTFD